MSLIFHDGLDVGMHAGMQNLLLLFQIRGQFPKTEELVQPKLHNLQLGGCKNLEDHSQGVIVGQRCSVEGMRKLRCFFNELFRGPEHAISCTLRNNLPT
jgi:hypothetical protein